MEMKTRMNQYEERSQLALKLHRKHRMRALVHRRRQAVLYLKRLLGAFGAEEEEGGIGHKSNHNSISIEESKSTIIGENIGNSNNISVNNSNNSTSPSVDSDTRPLWLGVVRLTPDSLAELSAAASTRCPRYLSLSLSLSKLLEVPRIELSTAALFQSCLQLFEEWDYNYSGGTVQSVKLMLARGTDTPLAPSQPFISSPSDPSEPSSSFKPSLFKFNNKVIFEYLQATYIDRCPFPLDYVEVLAGLMDCLDGLYRRFAHEETYSDGSLYDLSHRLDQWLQTSILSELATDIENMGSRRLGASLAALREGLH